MPPFQPYKCIIAGYSGTLGKLLTKQLLRSSLCQEIHALGRRELPDYEMEQLQPHSNSTKLKTHVVDFNNLDQKLIKTLVGEYGYDQRSQSIQNTQLENKDKATPINSAFCLLGARNPGSGFMNEMVKVDKDYAINFGRFCKKLGVSHMTLLTSLAANIESSLSSSRIKGEAIEEYKEMGFDRLSIFKPCLVLPEGNSGTISDRVSRIIHPIVAEFLPLSWRYVLQGDLIQSIIVNKELSHGEKIEQLTFVDFMNIIGKTPPEEKSIKWFRSKQN